MAYPPPTMLTSRMHDFKTDATYLYPEVSSFATFSTTLERGELQVGGDDGIRSPSRLPPSRTRYGGQVGATARSHRAGDAILHVARRAEAHASALARVSEGWLACQP
jgi:hypothetical protein